MTTRSWVVPALAYAGVTALLLPIPVLGLLHAESSAIVAGVSFFIAGLASIAAFRASNPLPAVAGRHLALLAVPLAVLTLSLLWRENCAYRTGLGLYIVLVPPSTLLGVALAYVLSRGRWPRTILVCTGLVVALGGVVWDLGWHPQLFTYSHIFGGVLGPIYDEELAIRPGLFVFRALTLLWSCGLVLVGRAMRVEGRPRRRLLGASAVVGVVIVLTYGFSVQLGFQQSHAALASSLGSESSVGAFVIHYDSDDLSPERRRRIEDELRFRYHQIAARLDVEPSEPIRVYLYPDEAAKGRLIGSRRTSVVPVWLPAPQIHMLSEEVERSLGHELVHVFAREFGMPGLRASPAVGLVEGLAVALEPPDGYPPPADAVRAALAGDLAADGLETDPAAVARATLDPIGFWTSRAGVAYTTSGAFVTWLLDRYGSQPFKQAYRTGDVEGAYGQSMDVLSAAWARSIQDRPVSPQAVAYAADLLTRRSLFERPCPHHVPAFVRDTRDGVEALDDGQVDAAREAFTAALGAEPTFEPALVGWAAALAASGVEVSRDSLRQIEGRALDSLSGPAVPRALADLHRLAARDLEADRLYAEALDRMPAYQPLGRTLLRLRRGLDRATLRALTSAPGDPATAAAAVGDRAPVEAALLADLAEQPRRAWLEAQRWDLDGLAATPVERAALASLQSRLAYHAADLDAAERLASDAASLYLRAGHPGPAALAADWAERARWRRAPR